MLSCVSIGSFLLLSNYSLYLPHFISLMIDIWAVSSFWLLQMKLRTFMINLVSGWTCVFIFLVKCLGHMIGIYLTFKETDI